MKRNEAKDVICEIGHRLHSREFISGTEGNISIRINNDEIWTTPSGVSKGFLTPGSLVRVNLRGDTISGGTPSSELKMHLRVYEKNKHTSAVIHAHPLYACICAASNKPIDKHYLTENIITLGSVPIANYATPSTEEVPESITPYLLTHKAVLLAHHGALTWDNNIYDAYNLMESVEAAAKFMIIAENSGGVKEIPNNKIAKLLEIHRNKQRQNDITD